MIVNDVFGQLYSYVLISSRMTSETSGYIEYNYLTEYI